MTESEGAPPVEADTGAPSNTPAKPDGEASTGAAGGDGWAAALDEDTRKTVNAKGWDKLGGDERTKAILSSYVELQKRSGQVLELPKADAKPEELQAWRDKAMDALGRPKTADEITFALPENLPDGVIYDEGLAATIKPLLHKAGVWGAEAQALHDAYLSNAAAHAQAQAEAVAARETAAHAALEKAWGPADGAKHKAQVELANRAIREFGGDTLLAELKSYGVLGADGSVRAPTMAVLLAAVGERFAEPVVPNGRSAGNGKSIAEILYSNNTEG